MKKNHITYTLSEFFRQSPLMEMEIDLTRNQDTGRDVDLFLTQNNQEFISSKWKNFNHR